MTTIEEDIDNMVLAAITLGFKELPNGKYECTKEHIVALCAIVANEAINQTMAETSRRVDE